MLDTHLDNRIERARAAGLSRVAGVHLVRWEVMELLEDGQITVTSLTLRGERVFRVINTYHPENDSEKHKEITLRHGPFHKGWLYYHEVWGELADVD